MDLAADWCSYAAGTRLRYQESVPYLVEVWSDRRSGVFTEAGNNAQRRVTSDPTGLGMFHAWAFSWPANRRVMYNRASADAEGKPWDSSRPGIAWNGERWVGRGNRVGPRRGWRWTRVEGAFGRTEVFILPWFERRFVQNRWRWPQGVRQGDHVVRAALMTSAPIQF